LLGSQHNLSQKKENRETKKKNEKKSNVNNVGSTKTMMIRNRYVLWRIATMLLALRSAAYQEAPSRRDATTTTLLPG
jgi:hypothetical protein